MQLCRAAWRSVHSQPYGTAKDGSAIFHRRVPCNVLYSRRSNATTPYLSLLPERTPVIVLCQRWGKNIVATWIPDGRMAFRSSVDNVECRLTYKEWKGLPAFEITLENKGNVPFQPVKAGIRLGIDTYMDKYPEWFGKYFPTLLMNGKTHFYGYMQTPSGHTLGLISPTLWPPGALTITSDTRIRPALVHGSPNRIRKSRPDERTPAPTIAPRICGGLVKERVGRG